MIEDTAAKKAVYEARQKINDLRKVWMEKYPDSIDQTFYNLVISHIDILMTLIRLSADVEE